MTEALSRINGEKCMTERAWCEMQVVEPILNLFQEIRDVVVKDKDYKLIKNSLEQTPEVMLNYKLQVEILMMGDRILIPKDNQLRK